MRAEELYPAIKVKMRCKITCDAQNCYLFPRRESTLKPGGEPYALAAFTPPPPRKYSWYSFLLDVESTPGS
jgi:hypothetical protein